MKALAIFYSCLLSASGCSHIEWDSNFELNNAGGRYLMTALIDITEGRAMSMPVANKRKELFVKRIVKEAGHLDEGKFPNQASYYEFRFYGSDGKETFVLEAARKNGEYDYKYFQEKQWLMVDDSSGLLVILEGSNSSGLTDRLMISNVMNSLTYKAELDTIRYIYRPKFK